MKLLALTLALVAGASPAPEGYNLPKYTAHKLAGGGCKHGEVLHIDGTCVFPKVTQHFYIYTAPEQPQTYRPPPYIPTPKVEQNIVFIRTPDEVQAPEPIILPPPRQNNIVYVLNKQLHQAQKVIEVPVPPPKNPEVYFIDYGEGDYPTLPDGTDIKTALNSAVQDDGQLISGAEGLAGGEDAIGILGIADGGGDFKGDVDYDANINGGGDFKGDVDYDAYSGGVDGIVDSGSGFVDNSGVYNGNVESSFGLDAGSLVGEYTEDDKFVSSYGGDGRL